MINQTTGKLIAIEGGDSAGKATQAKLLEERLKSEGVAVERLSFPQYNSNQMGALIRECLDGRHGDFFSFDPRFLATVFAVDRKESLPLIEGWLAEGKVIILDRYTSSNLLHQGAKIADQEARQAALHWIYRLEHEILGLPKPDMVVYLSIPAAKRMELLLTRLETEGRAPDVPETKLDHQEAVDRVAGDMLSVYPQSKMIECVNGSAIRTTQEIADDIYDIVRDTIQN